MIQEFPHFPQGKAAIFSAPGSPFKLINGEVPALSEGEILVKNLYTTICGSDVHTYCGHRKEPDNVVLGHEIVGDILWHHPSAQIKDLNGNSTNTGDRIVWSIFAAPPTSVPPHPDMPQKSAGLFKYGHAPAAGNDIFNGGLADYCILKSNTAFLKISKDIPLKVAATISCAHSTVAGALRIAGEIKDKRIIIFGAGLLGLSCSAMCREAGAKNVVLVDTDESRLKWHNSFGADEGMLFADIQSGTKQTEGDIIFDITGHPEAMKTGIDCLCLGGYAIWIGAVFPANAVQVDAEKIVRKLLTIRGLHNYNYQDFIAATSFVERFYQQYPFEQLVEKEFTLDDVEEAFGFAANQKPVRAGVKIS
ncbi:zinc-binding dehydrogenase [Mucilaginibacter jinjuensis]|uniref:alcohol dehydrogenase n=1 Tax=Mucilaginibacter jinjuensis TaxID=1176721 RepID=A0ABY7TE85_9SPHI|nr:zinc-binding dehydrogenase [Mucilaginibacter jinjuensis]WCT14835.1 zinc-binding dehydrogenase [Mucilaginibacter jinjuensis]